MLNNITLGTSGLTFKPIAFLLKIYCDFLKKQGLFQKRRNTEGMFLKNIDMLKNLWRHQMFPIPKGP